MADIRCLICNRVNDASAERCWYCNTLLPRQPNVLTPQERERLAGIRREFKSPEDETSTQPAEVIPPDSPPEPVKEEIPEWLERVRQLKQQDEHPEEPTRQDWVAEEQPDWLSELTGDAHAQPVPAAEDVVVGPAEEAASSENAIRDLIEQTVENLEEPGEEHAASVEQAPFKGDFFAEFDDILEPAHELTPQQVIPPDEMDLTEPDISEVPELDEVISTAAIDAEGEFPIAVEDLPDWLVEEKPESETQEDEVQEEAQPEPPPEKKIEKAQLPAWLASLRPVHSVNQEVPASEPEPEPQPEVVDHGILAGIHGTLPASHSPQLVKETHAFGSELRLSPAQRRNVNLLRLLVQTEDDDQQSQEVKQNGRGNQKLLRLLVTALVLLLVIIPLFSTSVRGVTPALYSTEVVDALGIIQSLPENTPVLVTAHFEAGLAGELDWTAQPMLRHLVERRVPLALSSTNVTGFAILKKMVGDAVKTGTGYAVDEKVVELGYLPGGTIGLGALVVNPLAALPFTTDIQPVGEVNVLKGINSLSDFGAVILITDNPDVARTWIEQIGRASAPVRTLVVVSAQAAPLVQPYFASGQVNGIVSGVSGALTYEVLHAAPGTASSRFNVYQIALLSAAVLILAGGIISAFVASSNGTAKEAKH